MYWCYPGFFQSLGVIPDSMDRLKICVNEAAVKGIDALSYRAEI